MQPHNHVERLTKPLWRSLQYWKFTLRRAFAGFEHKIPSLYHLSSGCAATSPNGDGPWPFCAISFTLPHIISKSVSVFVISNAWSSPASNSLLARANCLSTTFSGRVPPVVFECLQPITSRPREDLASTLTPCGMLENMSHATMERLQYFECNCPCCRPQSVISGIKINC